LLDLQVWRLVFNTTEAELPPSVRTIYYHATGSREPGGIIFMKVINFNIFQVIYYHYYLFIGESFRTIGLLSGILMIPLMGIGGLIFTLVYRFWIGFILAGLISYYIYYFLIKKLDKTGLAKKIIKKKPKILNSRFLSILVVISYTVLCFLILYICIKLMWKIDDMGICLIK